jgi:hypothetical protein
MLRRHSSRCTQIAFLPAAVFLLLSPAVWAADESQLAPATPERPWVIPSQVDGVERSSLWGLGGDGAERGDAVPI